MPGGAEVVSNNHFDQDRLVSIYALVAPGDAVQRRTFLQDVAFAGDFAICHDRDAAGVSMVLSALADGDDLPADYAGRTGVLYEDVLGRLPELCDHVERYRDVWGDEDATLEASDTAFRDGPGCDRGAARRRPRRRHHGRGHARGRRPRFGSDWVGGLHPMAVNTRSERVTLARLRGRRYDVELRYEGWVQLRSRPVRPRRDLVPLGRSEPNYSVYHDRYRRTPDGWRFSERVYEVRYLDTTPLTGSTPHPAAGAP